MLTISAAGVAAREEHRKQHQPRAAPTGGICISCNVKTGRHPARVCKENPMLKATEWQSRSGGGQMPKEDQAAYRKPQSHVKKASAKHLNAAGCRLSHGTGGGMNLYVRHQYMPRCNHEVGEETPCLRRDYHSAWGNLAPPRRHSMAVAPPANEANRANTT
jgi:hypothetical protein